MSLRRRAVERWETIRQGTRVALDLPKLVEFARTSPAQELARRARRAPGDLALAFREDRFTWGDVNEQTNRYANWFAGEGIGAGDVVALLMDNRPAYLFATMGLNRIGAVSALLNTNLRGRSLAHAIRVSRAAKILAGGESARAILEVAGELEDFSPEKELYVQHERGGGAGQGLRRINDEIGASSPDAPSEACTPSNRLSGINACWPPAPSPDA
jgi:acyl-coenzyme A synthetase/AMP-(fatty) acid ligase